MKEIDFSNVIGATLLNSFSVMDKKRIQKEFRTNFLKECHLQEAIYAAFQQNKIKF